MVCMLGISVAGSFNFLRHYSKQPWRQAAEDFQKNYQSGDVVVYFSLDEELALMKYLPPSFYDIPGIYLGSPFGPRQTRYFTNKSGSKSGMAALQSLNTNNGRVWLVLQDGQMYNSLAIAWLDVHYKKLKEWKLGEQVNEQIEMILYGPLGQTGQAALSSSGQQGIGLQREI
jgi:hypothetical protein